MENYKIVKPFTITQKILLPKYFWEREELGKPIVIQFKCIKCFSLIHFLYNYYTTKGYFLSEIIKEQLITQEELLKNASNIKKEEYAGADTEFFLFGRKIALYNLIECEMCKSGYLIVFGEGEVQPGRDQFEIAGVWNIKTLNT
jgi:hypothetical protein